MRRGWKVFWIVSAGLVIVGFLCCIIAFAMGASFNNVFERYDRMGSREEYRNVDELNFDITGRLNIKTHDLDTIIVEASEGSRQWKVTCSQSGGELRIKTRLWFNWIGSSDHGTINVYIPQGYQFQEANISLGAGKAEIEELNADEIKFEFGAGDGRLYDFTANDFKANCGAGRIDASGVLNGDAKIEAGVGQANLDLKGTEGDFNYDINCGVGSVKVGNNRYSGLGHSKKVDNGADRTIDIDCGVGEISVNFN